MRVKTICLLLLISTVFCACGSNTEQTTSTTKQEEESYYYTAYEYDGEPTDLFTIQEVELRPEYSQNGEARLLWKMKAKNTSGKDIPKDSAAMRIWYQYLDKDKANLWDRDLWAGYDYTIENDASEWLDENSTPAGWNSEDMKRIEYIKIFAYSNNLSAGPPDYEFKEPILIKISDFVDWDKIPSYWDRMGLPDPEK